MKNIIITFLLFSFSLIGYSQSSLSIGFLYGLNTSTFAGDNSDYAELKNGNRIGAVLEFAPNPYFSIEPQLVVTKKGSNFEYEVGSASVDLTYAEIPVLFNFKLPLGETIRPHIFGGPYFATRLDQDDSFTLGDQLEIDYTEIQIKNEDFGASVGAGIDFIFDTIFFSVNARADYGVNKIGDSQYYTDLRNRTYSINAVVGIILAD